MNTIINDYLQRDVEELIKAINENEILKEITINTTFETLGDFASYWEKHLDKRKRSNKDNLTFEYR
ncbi:MAG: hypothetical protein MJZ32_06180 [Bacteroidaceae bacterium]|nr:hypothetical protein [Bacteroidaceae bacterium]